MFVAKDHGPSVKKDKQYEGLRKKGMSKERAAKDLERECRLRQRRLPQEGREEVVAAAGARR